jgi:hypothetical protein
MKLGSGKCSYCNENEYIAIFLFPDFYGSFVIWHYVLPIIAAIVGIIISAFLGLYGFGMLAIILTIYISMFVLSEMKFGRCVKCGKIRQVSIFEKER